MIKALGNIAAAVIADLKGQPFVLVMLISNLMVVGLGLFIQQQGLTGFAAQMRLIIAACQ